MLATRAGAGSKVLPQPQPLVIQLTADARQPPHFSSLMAEALRPAADDLGVTLKPSALQQHADTALALPALNVQQQQQPLQLAAAAASNVAGAATQPAAAPRRPVKRPRSGSRKQAAVAAPARDDRPKRARHVGSCIHFLAVPPAPLAHCQGVDHTELRLRLPLWPSQSWAAATEAGRQRAFSHED
jgi:hypothetical protein